MHTPVYDITDTEILDLLANNSDKALHILYQRDSGYLNGVCFRYIGNDKDLEDVMHDAFLKIFSNIQRYKPREGCSLRSWMSRIVVNEAIDQLRRHRKLRGISIEAPPLDIPDEDPDVESIPTDVLHEMIRQLPVKHRTVLNLHVFEGKKHKEIASILDISENTSYSLFHRAKNMLAENIKKYKTTRL